MESMSDIPDRDRIAADERRVGELLRAVEAPAPAALRASITERYYGRRRVRGRRAPLFGLGFAAAAAAAAVALALVLSSSSEPTVVGVSKVALARPTGPAPARLIAAGTSIAFPDWSARGWPSAGVRRDDLGGRTVTTEVYRSYDGGTLGYSIASGAPLRWGAGATTAVRFGERYELLATHGTHVVTWVAQGHTCILASRTASAQTLLHLAVSQEHAGAA